MEWTPDQIRRRRNERGWSQEELGKAIGSGRRAVNNWENGHAAPQGKFIARLEAVLGDDSAEQASEVQPRTGTEVSAPVTEGVLLDDADFEQTMHHMARLYREALRAGNWLRKGGPSISPEFLSQHDTVLGPEFSGEGEGDANADAGAESRARHQP